jgi:mRNA interferase RelE/StbE
LSAYKVKLSRRAAKQLEELPAEVRSRVTAALRAIQQNPDQGVKLLGPLTGSRRYRVGDYRIVYQVNAAKRLVIVENIRHRGRAYRS